MVKYDMFLPLAIFYMDFFLLSDAPKVIFDMTVKFGSADLEKSKQETMV